MKKLSIGLGATALLSLGACAEGPANNGDDFGYNGTGIEVAIAPLTLATLSDACYSFAVVSQANELVVGRGPAVTAAGLPSVVPSTIPAATGSVCASQFGNTAGGDISYVAPCDASQPNHNVHLWVDVLCDSGTGAGCNPMPSYVDPCPDTNGCVLPVVCQENADTPVTFNFTIMGQADQGFFDIAVNFDDVFCSAKLDDCSTLPGGGEGPKIQLMFDADGNRINTVVAAVACTAGPGTGVTTQLQLTPLVLTCNTDGAPFGAGSNTINFANPLITQEGNLTGTGTYPAAVYFGTESLTSGGGNANKVFTNVAFGVGDASNCSLTWGVAPINAATTSAPVGPGVYSSYGYVSFAATVDNGMGGDACHRHPLNGTGSVVTTAYGTSVNGVGTLVPGLSAALRQGDTAFTALP